MRTFVSSLTAAMLLVHALIGCCRHHERHFGGGDTTEFKGSLVEAGCCHHEHPSCGHEHEQPHGPCKCKLECKALCIYLPPEKCVTKAAEFVVIQLDAPLESTACGDDAETARLSTWRTAARAAGPPLRLHLLHQIILV